MFNLSARPIPEDPKVELLKIIKEWMDEKNQVSILVIRDGIWILVDENYEERVWEVINKFRKPEKIIENLMK